MATFNYGNMVKTARRMIDKFGSDIVVTTSQPVVNPDPWKPGSTDRPQTPTKGVFTNYKEENVDGTQVRQGDQKVLFIAENFPYKPNTTGTIKRGTELWQIIKLMPLNPGGTIILYKAQVRQ